MLDYEQPDPVALSGHQSRRLKGEFSSQKDGSSLGFFEGLVHFEGLIILTHSQSVVLFFSKVRGLSVADYGTSEDLLICKPMSHFQRSERLWYDLI